MNTAIHGSRARHSHLPLLAILTALAVALAWFVAQKVHYLTDYSVQSFTDIMWPKRAALIPHLLGGFLAISTGVVQLWLGLTHRVHTLHRVLGKVYATGVLIASLAGAYLALTIPGHLSYSMGLVMLDVAWMITTGMALYAIRLRRIEQHREWMLRSYMVTFAFVTFRLSELWLRHWITLPDDPIADDLDSAMAWACWVVPLLLAEPLIQLRSMRRSAPGAGVQSSI